MAAAPMTNLHKEAIRKTAVTLEESLNTTVSTYLYTAGFFTGQDLQVINGQGTRIGEVRKIIEILTMKEDKAFNAFCNALRETEQEFLAVALECNLKATIDLEEGQGSSGVVFITGNACDWLFDLLADGQVGQLHDDQKGIKRSMEVVQNANKRKRTEQPSEVANVDDQLCNLHDDQKEIKRDLQQSTEEIIRAQQRSSADIKCGIKESKEEIKKVASKMEEVHLESKKASEGVQRPERMGTQEASGHVGVIAAHRFSSYLKQHYTSGENVVIQPFPWMDDILLDLDRMFTRLRVIRREKERSKETDEEVAMYEVFRAQKESSELRQRTVLIEGNPGIGKTSFCHKLVYDWAKGNIPSSSSIYFPEVEILLLLKCRDIEKGGIWQAIEDQLLPEELTCENEKRELFEYIKENQEKVMLIIDGYDELKAEKSVQECLMKVISGRVLSRCSIIVTTRHERGMKIRKHFNNLLEIKGFERKDTSNYFDRYFHLSPSVAKRLTDLVSNNSSLRDLVSSPLNTALLCVVYEESKDRLVVEGNSISLRELYHEIVFCVTKRYCVKEGKDNVDDNSLMEIYRAVHMILGKLAFDGLQNDELYFKESQLPPNERELLSKLGFLVKEKSARKLRSEGIFSFIHKTIQEYFAALYVADCLTDRDPQACCSIQKVEMISIIQRFDILTTVDLHVSTNKTIEFIRHLALLLPLIPDHNSRDSEDDYVAYLIDFDYDHYENYEDYDHHNDRDVYDDDDVDDDDYGEDDDYYCLQHITFIENNTYYIFNFLCKLIGNLSGEENEMQLTAISTCGCLPEWVHFSYPGEKSLDGLCGLLSSAKGDNSTSSFECSDAISGTTTTKSPFSHLKITGLNEMNDAMLRRLARAICQNKSLKSLDLSHNQYFHGSRPILDNGLGRNMSVLNISECSIGVEGGCKIADGLNSNDLTDLNMWSNEIGDDGAGAVAEMLVNNKSLKKLHLGMNKVGVIGCTALAGALTTNNTLISLNISINEIGDQGACAIANDALMNNSSLTHLYINSCGITDVGTCAIADVLTSKNNTLTHLEMGWNGFGGGCTRAIADLIIKNTRLSYLNVIWFKKNEPCEGATRALADAVSRNTTLTYICIGKMCGTSTLTQDPRVHVCYCTNVYYRGKQ